MLHQSHRVCALAASLLLLFLGAPSCTKETHPLPEIRLNLSSEPMTMDPRKGGDPISSHMHFLLFEGLVKSEADGSVSCAQAERFTLSEDKTVYTFYLRKSQWSNGDPVTAYDFERSWKAVLDPKFPAANAHLFYPIKNAEAAKKGSADLSTVGVVAHDAETLVVTLERPTPYFLDLISFCTFFPVHHTIDQKNPKWALSLSKDFVSNGPYQLSKWKHHHEIVATRNPFYWNKDHVVSHAIAFTMVDHETTALDLYTSGKLDMVGEPLSPLPIDALLRLQKTGALKKHPIPATTFITFNTRVFPFHNQHMRQAFALAADRQALVDHITQLQEEPALGMIPPVLKKGEGQTIFFSDHAVDQAREHLKLGMQELGIKRSDLQHLTYIYPISEKNKLVAETLQQQWANVLGLHVRLEASEFNVILSQLSKKNYTFGQMFWAAQYNDPMNIFERFKFAENAKNYTAWEDAEYIRLLDASAYATAQERALLLDQAERLFLEAMPLSPLFHWDLPYVVSHKLSGVELSPIGDIYFERLKRID